MNKGLYQPYILSHPMNTNISLTQEHDNFFSINDSDVQTMEYVENIVSNNFFNNKNLSLPQLYLLNVAFPFEKLKNIELLKKISGHDFTDIKTEKIKYIFDDHEDILGQNVIINGGKVKIDNDFLIEKLTQVYWEVKKKIINLMKP